jgi:transcriptional regulator with XRE-family HTH domain
MNQNLSSLSSKLRSLRAERGWSQEYMAKRLDISQKTYSRWENKADELSKRELEAICTVFGIAIDKLFSKEEDLLKEIQNLHEQVNILQNTVNHFVTPSTYS